MNTSTSALTSEMMTIDEQLAQLLNTMNLTSGRYNTSACIANEEPLAPPNPVEIQAQDASMSDSSDGEEEIYQPSPLVSSNSTVNECRPPCGCGLLQYIQSQLSCNEYPTTNGDYLDTIFTHREAFFAFPQGHKSCSVGFSDMASKLEKRAWRSDREGDMEAVSAFRHEAWVIANAAVW